jgi:two-component system, chemotaxis family, sensor kinase CheA
MENSNFLNPANNPHLLNTFREEAYELVTQLENMLLNIDCNSVDKETINSIFRVMHTLKGNGALFGFTYISEFTHKMEDAYDKIRNNQLTLNDEIVGLTLSSVDILRSLIENPVPDTLPSNYQKLLDQVSSIIPTVNPIVENAEETMKIVPDKSSFYIYFNPGKDILDDGTNPLYLIQDLYSMGTCLIIANTNDIPAGAEFIPEKNYLQWHILIDTSKSQTDIEENFIFLNDQYKPIIFQITTSLEITLLDDFTKIFRERAQKTEYIQDIDQILKRMNPLLKKARTGETENRKDSSTSDFSQNRENQKKDTDIKTELSSIRVSSEKIDVMLNLISELITKQAALTLACENSGNPLLQEIAEGIESLSHNLRDTAFSISLVPLGQSLVRFKRMVHDVSAKVGKKVSLIIEGGETELDKTIIENILDPVMHILRNSIDHGIEMPEDRIALGKAEQGSILLKAYYSGANVIIQISDDGKGIDLEKVKNKAISKGIIKETDKPTDEELIQMIMYPGFSTADKVSDVSGRGVGMDVVNQKIRDVHGDFEIKTHTGYGTSITITLPLTISIIDTLLVKIADSSYLISLSMIDTCEEITIQQLKESHNNYMIINNIYTPFINLSTEFSIPFKNTEFIKMILVKYQDYQVGLIVDQIIGKFQAVLKPLGELYRKQEFISGASIMGNGEIALLLDTNKLIKKVSTNRKVWLKSLSTVTIH